SDPRKVFLMLASGPAAGRRSRPDGLGARRTFTAMRCEENRFGRLLFCAITSAACLAMTTVLTGLTPACAQTGPFEASPVPSLDGVYPLEPPLSLPRAASLPKPENVITFADWTLSPTMRVYSFYDTNLYESPVALSAAGLRIFPTLVAQWTNGIHTTTLYGQVDIRQYPELSASNTFDRQAGIIQKYEMFRDLTFTVNGDYIHETNAAALRGAIPGPITTPGTPAPGTGSGSDQGPTVINPFDQFTGTASVEKIFNRGIIKLSTSFSRTEYERDSSSDFSVKSFRGIGAFWLGPLLY